LDLFRSIFSPFSRSVPKRVSGSLPVHFAGAIGAEWTSNDEIYEAIFYHDDIEKIARFDKEGTLIEYRVNINPDQIPSPIREAVAAELEIMNCIAVYTSEKLNYELIVRDRKFVRYLLMLDSLGNSLLSEQL